MEKPTIPNLADTGSTQQKSGDKPEDKTRATPLRCFTGALTAGTLALLAYRLTLSIATTFANKPIVSDNPAVLNISSAVRTLVVGIVALGAGVFGVAALGLAGIGIQLLIQGNPKKDDSELKANSSAGNSDASV